MTTTRRSLAPVLLSALAAITLLSACEGSKLNVPRAKKDMRVTETGRVYGERETLFGEGGLTFGSDKNTGDQGGGIGVNSFLWRASLDTITFMPVASADPFGGVIITDWYAPPETPNERFKLNIYVLGTALRADGVRASVFRQVLDSSNSWRDAQVEPDAGRKIEDAILSRARQLRNETRLTN